ncbi:MAG TPA: NAD(P)H-hydrate dehydratase, partial [Burkholderiales bacterium]|nr:NAD(P)H-hydrate dehydratase [Burkholderiales bacterium]
GLHSDTGRVLGQAVRATHTVTFIALKPGLLTLDGPDYCGLVHVADLGLDAREIVAPAAWVADPAAFKRLLKPRPRNFHKGMAGSLGILGGAAGMTGAALLAGRAALKLGAGRVYVGLLSDEVPVDLASPELMLRHPDDALGQDLDAIVAGPGIGQGERAETLVGAALASDLPCVLDADALNLIAESEDLRHACARRSADTILTPHPAEAARLLALKTADVQADRVKAARILAANLNAHVVLKGAGSILVARDGHWFINTSGNAGMASAGMGDALSGILGALLAQRHSGESALVLGVHLHGSAADELVAGGAGPVGLTAGEIADAARRRWNAWLGYKTS